MGEDRRTESLPATAPKRQRLVIASAVVVVLAMIAGGFVLARLVRSDPPPGPWHTPLWSNWSAASIDDACTVGVCVGDTVALPLGRPVEAVVDLSMPEELGALSIERAWIGERAGMFGAGWATVWDVRLIDGKFVGPLPALPIEAPRRGQRVALEGGATLHVDDQGRLDEVCLDAAACTSAEWSDDALVLRPEVGSATGAGPGRRPVVRLSLDDGVVSRAASVDGRTVRYRYASGRLASVVRGHDQTVYGYDSGRLASIDDGVQRTYSYGPSGEVVATSDLGGGRWTITQAPTKDSAAEAGASGRTFEVKSPDGWTRTYRFTSGALVEVVDSAQGVLLRRTITGGRLTLEERPLDGVRSERVSDDELRVTQQQDGGRPQVARYWFDDAGRLIRTQSAEGLSRIRYQGSSERPTEVRGPDGTRRFDYDGHGLLLATEDADRYRVEVERNELGQPVAVTDGVTRTEFAYDSAGRTTQQRSGGKTTTASYRADGLIASLTSSAGGKLPATYDDQGRLQTLGGADAEPANDPARKPPDGTGSPLESVKTVERSDGTFEQRYRSGETAILDGAGRPIKVTIDGRTESRRYDDAGHLAELRLPGGSTYKLTYTAAGRVASIADEAVKAKLTWHGDLLMSIDTSAGSSYRYDYDEAGRVVTATSGPLRWDYTYDKAGRSSVVRGPSGVVETRWDSKGRPVDVRDGGHVEHYRWTGDKLDLAGVDIDGETILDFRRNTAGKISELTAADTGTVELGYDPDTGVLNRYRIGDSEEVTLAHDGQGRVVAIKSGDRTETWKWAKGNVAEVRVDGEKVPYRLGWLAPGLLGDARQGERHLLRTKVDAAGRPAKLWAEGDLAATLSWNDTGLARASIEGQPAATFVRDEERRPVRVQVDDQRIDWRYQAGALTRVENGDRATSFEYDNGRLSRTVDRDGEDTSTITWDRSRARPKAIDTPEGEAAFAYRDAKVQAIRIDGENQQVRYRGGKSTAKGDAGQVLEELFNDSGRYQSALGESTLGPAAPWIAALPADLGVALPEVVTGRQIAETAIDNQVPNTPGFLLDDSKNLATRTALGFVASAAAEPAVVGPDQVSPSGIEVTKNELQLDLPGTADGFTAESVTKILGPDPGALERIREFGQSLVGAISHGVQVIQRFVSQNPVGRFIVTASFAASSYFSGGLCLSIGVCAVVAAGLWLGETLATAEPGQTLASAVVAAVFRPYRDLRAAIESGDPLDIALSTATAAATVATVVLPMIGRFRPLALESVCGLRPIVCVSAERFGPTGKHVLDAQRHGSPRILRIDRQGAAARRSSDLRRFETRPGFDRDEYPFALSSRRSGLSIRYVDPASNRSLGAYLGNQLRDLPDGTRFFVLPVA